MKSDALNGQPSASVEPAKIAIMATGQLPYLDGLRAISVLMVIVGHFGFGSIVPGGLGVTIFFFISGFLITTLMLREARAFGHIAVGQFYIRRALRLQPELWALLVMSGIGGALFGLRPSGLDFIGGFFYLTNYAEQGLLTGGLLPYMRWPQLWSLAVEEHYYLTFPLLFIAFFKTPHWLMRSLFVVLIAALAVRIWYFASGVSTDHIYAVTETRIDSIAFGCVGALLLWYMPERRLAFAVQYGRALLIVALLILAASIALRHPWFRDTFRYSVQGGALLLLFVGLFAGSNQSINVRLLEMPLLKWMGRMSYGAYLWHLEAGNVTAHLLHLPEVNEPSLYAAGMALLYVAVSFGIAFLSYTLLQRPVVALRHRFSPIAVRPVEPAK